MYNVAIEILNILKDNNLEGYIVGGYVRDKYLGINNLDIDICTSAKKDELDKLFNIKDKGFNSYDLFYKDYKFDVTTYRKEEYNGTRFPKVEYTILLEEDLKRRDFTINALCIDYKGKYIDLLGSINDLNNKIIKCIGDSDIKIKEDVLRSLRAIRFAGNLNFKLDENLKKSIIKYDYLLDTLSSKRIESELSRMNENSLKLIKELNLNVK